MTEALAPGAQMGSEIGAEQSSNCWTTQQRSTHDASGDSKRRQCVDDFGTALSNAHAQSRDGQPDRLPEPCSCCTEAPHSFRSRGSVSVDAKPVVHWKPILLTLPRRRCDHVNAVPGAQQCVNEVKDAGCAAARHIEDRRPRCKHQYRSAVHQVAPGFPRLSRPNGALTITING